MFHACSSCGLQDHEYYYCTTACWKASVVYKVFKSVFETIPLEMLHHALHYDDLVLPALRDYLKDLEHNHPQEKQLIRAAKVFRNE